MHNHIKYLIIFFFSFLFLLSCSKLTEHPSSVIVSNQFYTSSADAIAAVNAVYNTLNSDPLGDFPMYGRQLNLLTDNASDNQIFSPSNTNPDVRALGTTTYVSINSRILKNWQQQYFGINRANIAIDNVAAIPAAAFSDTALQSRLINEAKFIRALLYFNVVRLWGPVPLILHNPTSVDVMALQVPRTSADSVYLQIIQDLTDATRLPASYGAGDLGRATSGAAHTLLAKLYVTRKQWQKAQTELQEVITGGYGYALFSDFKDVFQKATKNGSEHIFSVQFATNGGEANSTQNLSQSFTSFNTGTYPIDIPADSSIAALFDDMDARKAVTFYTSQFNAQSGQTIVFHNPYTPYFNKFVDYSVTPLNNQPVSGVNYTVLRYAEVLLLNAETLNEINGGPTADAYRAINQVRERAHIPDLTPGLSQSDFRDSVFLERRKEFIQEGQRWFDLVRQGGDVLVSALKIFPAKQAASLKDSLYPIPLTEIQLDPLLTQNPGW